MKMSYKIYPHTKVAHLKICAKRNTSYGVGVYLDYAATTPIDPKVLKAMLPYFKRNFGNPNSIHLVGQKARSAVDEARQIIAGFLCCSADELIFTSGATEANNLAIQGIIRAVINNQLLKGGKPHIITSKIEHDAVLEPCRALEKRGEAEVSYLPVDREGFVRVADLEKAIKENTILVSIMYANNEIGTIQPIAEIGQVIKKINSPNIKHRTSNIYFHTDAVQAVNYLDCDVEKLGVDLLTLSGHKIYGPKGVGVLYIRRGTPISPLVFGGGQENGLRPGTENVAAIVGLGAAVKEVQNPKHKIENIIIRRLRDKLIKVVLRAVQGSKLNGSLQNRLPNNANFIFLGAEGEAVVIALDQKGIYVSTGSACSAKTLEPSHVLLALGLKDEEAHCSLRITLGKYTTEREVEKLLKILPSILKKLRKISGYKT